MSYKKNDTVKLTITDLGTSGEGIGRVDGYTLFVKDALIGDEIEAKILKAKKNYGYGRLMKILKASPARIEAKCPVARQCGGCQIQQMNYEAQLDFKRSLVEGNLERIGGFTGDSKLEVLPVIGMESEFNYRNKAQYPVGLNKEGKIVMGFYAGRTHSIIDNQD
ncbi:MAG: class I SAM-dependent RNA methyltransferase, partial [Lachnospira sp.]|nr:class I SAM-dependent RNA methyltransferase [Lachnospira sp.]